MNTEQKIIKNKLGLLKLAENLVQAPNRYSGKGRCGNIRVYETTYLCPTTDGKRTRTVRVRATQRVGLCVATEPDCVEQ